MSFFYIYFLSSSTDTVTGKEDSNTMLTNVGSWIKITKEFTPNSATQPAILSLWTVTTLKSHFQMGKIKKKNDYTRIVVLYETKHYIWPWDVKQALKKCQYLRIWWTALDFNPIY